MADNLTGSGATIATDDISSVHYPRNKLALGADGTAVDAVAGAGAVDGGTQRVTLASDDPAVTSLGVMDDWDDGDAAKVVGRAVVVSANFTRPADTTAYASGDLVANSTTAGSVTPLSWTAARTSGGSAVVRRARLKKSTTGTTNAAFRLHLYASSPTLTNGDNGAWLSTESGYLGAVDITVGYAFSASAKGIGVPVTGSEITFVPGAGQTIYGLLEARGAYTPGNAEVFTVELEVWQN